MALPEFSPAPSNAAPPPVAVPAPLPAAALRRLPQLHDESRLALRRAGLMARAVPAAGCLLAMATLAAMFGGGELTPTFLWSLLVFFGVAAVLVSHLRAASVFKEIAGSAADMRAILLYLGVAWGLGAFLALSAHAAPLVIFTAAPVLVLSLMLADLPAILAFAGPATFFGVSALLLRTGNMTAAAILLFLQLGCGLWLLRNRTRSGMAPPGLA